MKPGNRILADILELEPEHRDFEASLAQRYLAERPHFAWSGIDGERIQDGVPEAEIGKAARIPG